MAVIIDTDGIVQTNQRSSSVVLHWGLLFQLGDLRNCITTDVKDGLDLPRDDPVLDHHTEYQWSSIIKDSRISSREAPTQENRTTRGSSRSSIRDDLALGYGWYRPI
jgi:hypothetical protein